MRRSSPMKASAHCARPYERFACEVRFMCRVSQGKPQVESGRFQVRSSSFARAFVICRPHSEQRRGIAFSAVSIPPFYHAGASARVGLAGNEQLPAKTGSHDARCRGRAGSVIALV